MVTVETGPPGIPPLAGIVSLGPVVSWQVVPSRTNACSTGARSMRLPANSYPVRHWAARGRGAAGGALHPGDVGVNTTCVYVIFDIALLCRWLRGRSPSSGLDRKSTRLNSITL